MVETWRLPACGGEEHLQHSSAQAKTIHLRPKKESAWSSWKPEVPDSRRDKPLGLATVDIATPDECRKTGFARGRIRERSDEAAVARNSIETPDQQPLRPR
jgi:hypothetical protein